MCADIAIIDQFVWVLQPLTSGLPTIDVVSLTASSGVSDHESLTIYAHSESIACSLGKPSFSPHPITHTL